MIAPAPPPPSPSLAIRGFTKVFDKATSSHKFLWLLAILDALPAPESAAAGLRIPMPHLIYRMLDLARGTLEQFKLERSSYHDRFREYLEDCRRWKGLFGHGGNALDDPQDSTGKIPRNVYSAMTSGDSAPYRFLVPFLPKGVHVTQRRIRELAADMAKSDSPAPYHFIGDGRELEVHPAWARYLIDNMAVVRGWTLWHWLRFLEVRNPNTPSLAAKVTGITRGSLARQRRLWDAAILSFPKQVQCIYTGKPLDVRDYSLDHYLPWEFIGHDNLWNLAPTLRAVNSAKGIFLPADRYLDGLAGIHHLLMATYHQRADLHRECGALMLSYLADLQVDAHESLPDRNAVVAGYRRVLPALVALAGNQGFDKGWQYRA